MKNKKTLILSIIGVLVLVIAVVGVSFAMYTFTGTGTTQNVIQTGTITMNFSPSSTITLDKEYPMSDAKGIQKDPTEFGVQATWGSTKMSINYDLGIYDIHAGEHLTAEYIKIALVNTDNNKVLVGTHGEQDTELTGGVTIASLSQKAGQHNLITEYGLTGGTITTSGTTDNYKLYAWISDEYDLDTEVSVSDEPGEGETTHKKETTAETFKFKVRVQAEQQG